MVVNSAPIFVVGSPRSGTSILTWCLGQHPNILPQEESNWMGEFARYAAACHVMGSSRNERSQLSAIQLPLTDFLAKLGAVINSTVLGQREAYYANAWLAAHADPELEHYAFKLTRDAFVELREVTYDKARRAGAVEAASLWRNAVDEGVASYGKYRWIDGTPEYALQLPGLRKLFPGARFIHIVRDVRSVVKSMLKLCEKLEFKFVNSEQDAYEYWLRSVRACLEAEKAWGSSEVLRVRYPDLVERPRTTIARILRFVSEPFSSACLEPLSKRINSSQVPSDYDPTDPDTDPAVREEAENLSAELMSVKHGRVGPTASSAAALEEVFRQRVAFAWKATAEFARIQKIGDELQKELGEQTAWNHKLDKEVVAKDQRIAELQGELEQQVAWNRKLDQELAEKNNRILGLQTEVEDRSAWALRLDRELDAKNTRIAELQKEHDDSSAWALRLDRELDAKNTRIAELQRELDAQGAWNQKRNPNPFFNTIEYLKAVSARCRK